MYVSFGNAQTGDVGPTLGPYPFVQLTYGLVRAGEAGGDARVIASYRLGTWWLASEGQSDSEWTDVSIHDEVAGVQILALASVSDMIAGSARVGRVAEPDGDALNEAELADVRQWVAERRATFRPLREPRPVRGSRPSERKLVVLMERLLATLDSRTSR